MKTFFLRLLLLCIYLTSLSIKQTTAQTIKKLHTLGRFKLGVGETLISNEDGSSDFNSFFAPTFYLSYSFIKSSKFAVNIESFFACRSKEDEFTNVTRNGLAVALPLLVEYHLSKIGFYAGSGPAFVNQTLEYTNPTKVLSLNGIYEDITGGIGIGFKKCPKVMLNFRIHYLKSFLQNKEDGGMLSLFISFGG